jgi:hypothetical protein
MAVVVVVSVVGRGWGMASAVAMWVVRVVTGSGLLKVMHDQCSYLRVLMGQARPSLISSLTRPLKEGV